MLRKLLASIFILAFLIAACQGGDNDGAKSKEKASKTAPQYVGYTMLSQGIQTGIRENGDFIIRNKKQLDSIWKIHYSYMSFTPESPNINFDEEIVIAVFLGEKPSTGYWLRLDSVYLHDDEEVVAITVNDKPDKSKETLSVVTYPFLIASITKTDYDLKFDFMME